MEATPLQWFENAEQLEGFCRMVTRAYLSCQGVTAAAGLALGDARHAVLLTTIVRKMLAYADEQSAAPLDPDLAAHLEREVEAVWSIFRDTLDVEIAEARVIFESMNPEDRGTVN